MVDLYRLENLQSEGSCRSVEKSVQCSSLCLFYINSLFLLCLTFVIYSSLHFSILHGTPFVLFLIIHRPRLMSTDGDVVQMLSRRL